MNTLQWDLAEINDLFFHLSGQRGTVWHCQASSGGCNVRRRTSWNNRVPVLCHAMECQNLSTKRRIKKHSWVCVGWSREEMMTLAFQLKQRNGELKLAAWDPWRIFVPVVGVLNHRGNVAQDVTENQNLSTLLLLLELDVKLDGTLVVILCICLVAGEGRPVAAVQLQWRWGVHSTAVKRSLYVEGLIKHGLCKQFDFHRMWSGCDCGSGRVL